MTHITSDTQLEAIVGTPNPAVRMKQLDALDDGCRRILASAVVAGFGYRDAAGAPHTTIVGGEPGFARVESSKRLSFAWAEGAGPARGGASFVFLLPGVGETLRVNGAIVEAGGRVVVDVEEAFIHCPRCILRSGLWDPPRARAAGDSVASFLAAAPFALVSTWDAQGASDTSPRGDHPGFLRLVDEHTLLIPDRRGNQRTDTFHNLLGCDQIALAVLVPGRGELLRLRGTARITDDAALLAPMAIGGRAPSLGLLIAITHAEVVPSAAVRAAWAPRVGGPPAPDMMAIAVGHLALSKRPGAKAALLRLVTRILRPVLARFPAWFNRKIAHAFAKQLADEGYARGLRPRPATVVEIVRETPDAVTLLLEDPTGAPFAFRAGQYFTLCIEIDGVEVRRAYSASSLPGAPRLALTIKRVPGGLCSTYVNERLVAGTRVGLLGPSGSFYPPSGCRELVFIAGGSGITPVMSLARSHADCRITLLYGNRSEPDIIFARALAGERLTVRHVLESPPPGWDGAVGRLDPATLARELPVSDGAHFFVCGPEPMIAGAQQVLAARGVAPERIHVERFAQPQRKPRAKARRLPMLVEHHGLQQQIDVAPGQTLLEAGLEAALPMPFSCGIGNCGECRVRLTAGDVELDEPSSLTPEERTQGYILACCARPLTAVAIRIEDESPTRAPS